MSALSSAGELGLLLAFRERLHREDAIDPPPEDVAERVRGWVWT